MLLSLGTSAQSLMVSGDNTTIADLTNSELQRYNKLLSSPKYATHAFASFGSLSGTQLNGKIKINLPGSTCGDLIFKVKAVEYSNEQSYFWHGNLLSEDTCNCSDGVVSLISSEFGRMGTILLDEENYEINQLSPTRFVVSRINDTLFAGNECAVNENTPFHLPVEGAQPRNDGNCDVRCLVLFTQNAANSVLDINNLARLGVRQTNQALRNSAIDECQLNLILVGIEELPGFVETPNDPESDVIDLTQNPIAQGRRNATEADLVVLLTDGDYGIYNGLAAAIGPMDEDAYCIVNTNHATDGRYVFAHEVGHLFGAGHNDDPRTGIPHGHQFLKCLKQKRTIMHKLPSGKSRIQHYSNPDVKYSGKRTGESGSRDNAQQMRNEACVVANFRQTIVPFGVGIGGDNYACPCGTALVEAITTGGAPGPYTFTWFSSLDGIIWTTLGYTGANAAVVVPCVEGEGIIVRVDALSSDGQFRSTSTFIEAATEWPGQQAVCPRYSSNTTRFGDLNLTIAPNPTSEAWQVNLYLQKDNFLSIQLVDIDGRLLYTLSEQFFIAGEHGLQLDGMNIKSGVYFLRLSSQNGLNETVKLLKF